ncbi:methylcrotonoyl-CoA carboxylase, partial [bacterium]|nr:methylcrotonoyl-CoA carboxylase [bacterium]
QLEKQGNKLSDEEIRNIREPIIQQYEEQASPYYSTARIWDDGIIDPLKTREILALSIAMSLNSPIPDHNFGVFRM